MKVKVFYKYLLFICSVGFSRFIHGFIATFNIAIFPSIIEQLSNQTSSNYTNGTIDDSFNYEKLGLLFASKGMTVFIFSPVAGILIDIFSPLRVFLSGLLLRGVSMLMFAFGNQYYLLIIGRLIEGCSASIINCSIDSLISFKIKGHSALGFLYGVYYLFLFIGMSTGPVIGGYMFENHGRVTPFLLGVLLTICEGIIVMIIIIKKKSKALVIEITDVIGIQLSTNGIVKDEEEINENKEIFLPCDAKKPFEKNKIENISQLKVISGFLCDKYIHLVLLAQAITSAARFSYFAVLPRHMMLQFQVTEFKQGAVYILNVVGYGAGFAVGGILNMRLKPYRYIILIALSYVNAIAVIIIPFMPSWWTISFPLCLLAFLNLIFDIIISPIFTSITEKRHNRKFGIMSGLKMMNNALVVCVTSLLAPVLYKKIGFLWLSVIFAILNAAFGSFHYFLRIFT